jgi:hypothetical protein
MTALEIKTGKLNPFSADAYQGQVLIYSILISERFMNANKDNFLVYIMKTEEDGWFKEIKQSTNALAQLIIKRNEIAKWHKKGEKAGEGLTDDILALPPMAKSKLKDVNITCKRCFNSEVCCLAALSFEPEKVYPLPTGEGNFPKMFEMKATISDEIKLYFKKWFECI